MFEYERAYMSHVKFISKRDGRVRGVLKRAVRGQDRYLTAAMEVPAPFRPGSAWQEEMMIFVAGLHVLHPADWLPSEDRPITGNFGRSMALMAARTYGEGPDRRFARMIDQTVRASARSLKRNLQSGIMLLRREEVRVDYARLLYDLVRWEQPGRPVQKRWAHAFYAGLERDLSSDTKTPETTKELPA